MAPRPNDPDLTWTGDDAPVSNRFGDVYFSSEDGLAETEAVFLQGCGLPEAWAGRAHFAVAELGFGTGLNIAALLTLWRRTRPAGARLSVFTVEGYPMGREDAARALSRWPQLSEAAAALTAAWPKPAPGFHRLDLPGFDATVDVAVMDAAEALRAWDGRADAWFLDGFSPAANPGMWTEEVLGLVRAKSAPGARAATFTVAGHVRRALAAQGFTVEKRPGFGRKRERLEARLDGAEETRTPPSRIAVIGGGVAGASVVRALRLAGADPVLIEAEAPAAGASGNPAGLVTPRFDAGGGATAEFFAAAFERAAAVYRRETPGAILTTGALQLETAARDAGRFDKIVGQPMWDVGALERLDGEGVSTRLGEPTNRAGMLIREGLVIAPREALPCLLREVNTVRASVARLERGETGWRLLDEAGALILEAEAVVIAAGWGLAALRPGIGLRPARGQASWTVAGERPHAAAWGGYVIPTRDGFLFGATFDRGDTACDLRSADHQRNLSTLAEARPGLAASVDPATLDGRARIRATTPDHLPLCGELEPGLWVLGGLGSRGFTTAPLLGEHLAARLLGRPSPLPLHLSQALEPGRFETASEASGSDLS